MPFQRLFFTILAIITLTAPQVSATSPLLTDEQNLWLDKRNRTILVRPERNRPPFVFVGSGVSRKPQGLSIDYFEAAIKKINTSVQYFEAASKANIIAAVKEGKDGVVVALTQTEEREGDFYFTKPYITIPAVIVVRKDSSIKNNDATLADFTGKRVAVGEAYAVEEYIKNNYKKVIIEPVADDEVGLQKVLLGEVDAAVVDLASLSYYTANKALSYVVVGGQTGFDYTFSFGIPKHLPELAMILDDALAAISPQEQLLLKEKWITPPAMNGTRSVSSVYHFFGSNTVLVVGSILAGALIILIGMVFLIRALRKTQLLALVGQKRHTAHSDTVSLQHELQELAEASQVVSEELVQIKQLEKEIAEKIKEIK
jgi:ABC-type amino acid transport substrate-binding protein